MGYGSNTRVYDFTDIYRIDLTQFADLLGIQLPPFEIASKESQPEGIVRLLVEDGLQEHFHDGDRILLLPGHMAAGFAPSGDYCPFMTYVQEIDKSDRNKVIADPFYSFMFNKVGQVYIAKVDEIKSNLINFAGRTDGYLALQKTSRTMQ